MSYDNFDNKSPILGMIIGFLFIIVMLFLYIYKYFNK